MLAKQLSARETGLRGCCRAPVCGGLMESFECNQLDEYRMEGAELGSLIPPIACCFSKVNANHLAVVDEDGGVLIVDTLKSSISSTRYAWLSHKNAVFDVDWMPGEEQIVTASGDQSLALWDVKTEEKLSSFRGHTSSVKTVRFLPGSQDLFASGSRDGHVMVWDKRIAQREGFIPPVLTIRSPHIVGGASEKKRKRGTSVQDRCVYSVTAVLFHDHNTLISAGSTDGSVKFWDFRKCQSISKTAPVPRHIFTGVASHGRSYGLSSLSLDSSGTRLFASCLDHFIYQYDCASFRPQPVSVLRGHLVSSFYIKTCVSPDDRFLLSGSSDNNAYIWSIENPSAPPIILTGHAGEVSAVAWCPADLGRLVTLSDDNTMWIWRTRPASIDILENTNTSYHSLGVAKKCASSNTNLLSNGPSTPRKGSVVKPQSPAKISSVIRQSILSLHRPSTSGTTQSVVTAFANKSKPSASVTNFFGKSPRKLIVTPKKNTCSATVTSVSSLERGVISGAKRRLSVEYGPSSTDGRLRTPDSIGVVGSLSINDAIEANKDDDSSVGNSAKRVCVEKPVLAELQFNPDQCSPTHNQLHDTGTFYCERNKCAASRSTENLKSLSENLAINSIISSTTYGRPVSTFSSPTLTYGRPVSTFSSPTLNLPNLVLDSQHESPTDDLETESVHISKSASKTSNWLTQLRIEKQQTSGTTKTVRKRIDDASPSSKSTKTPAKNSHKKFTTPKSTKR